MIRIFLRTSIIFALLTACFQAQAALVSNSTLLIGAGSSFTFGPLGTTSITGVDGIVLGSMQPYAEPNIDTWSALLVDGRHYTTAPTNILSSNGSAASIDFTGWSWALGNLSNSVDLGTGAWGSNPDGIAEIICAINCNNGDTFTLFYTATAPNDTPNGYAGMEYSLTLAGTVSAVPIPASIILFGSGLLGLLGVSGAAHRKGNCSQKII